MDQVNLTSDTLSDFRWDAHSLYDRAERLESHHQSDASLSKSVEHVALTMRTFADIVAANDTTHRSAAIQVIAFATEDRARACGR